MSKSYIKKSHLHKPKKGLGSYDRSREEDHIYNDLKAELDIASQQEAHRKLQRENEITNGQPENEPLRGEFAHEDTFCMCARQATFCDCNALNEPVVRVQH